MSKWFGQLTILSQVEGQISKLKWPKHKTATFYIQYQVCSDQ
jgi:hypothetical protein